MEKIKAMMTTLNRTQFNFKLMEQMKAILNTLNITQFDLILMEQMKAIVNVKKVVSSNILFNLMLMLNENVAMLRYNNCTTTL